MTIRTDNIKTPRINRLDPKQVITINTTDLFDNNPDYQKTMSQTSSRVIAPLPETYGFGLVNNVEQSFSSWQSAKQFITSGTALAHMNINRGFSERMFWKNVENQEVTVELSFNAYYSGFVDVIEPVNKIMKMSAAKEAVAGGQEESNPTAYWNAPPKITVIMGQTLFFTNCWVKSATATFSNKLDDNYDPMSATVSLTFITEDPIGYNGITGAGRPFSGFNSARFKDY